MQNYEKALIYNLSDDNKTVLIKLTSSMHIIVMSSNCYKFWCEITKYFREWKTTNFTTKVWIITCMCTLYFMHQRWEDAWKFTLTTTDYWLHYFQSVMDTSTIPGSHLARHYNNIIIIMMNPPRMRHGATVLVIPVFKNFNNTIVILNST